MGLKLKWKRWELKSGALRYTGEAAGLRAVVGDDEDGGFFWLIRDQAPRVDGTLPTVEAAQEAAEAALARLLVEDEGLWALIPVDETGCPACSGTGWGHPDDPAGECHFCAGRGALTMSDFADYILAELREVERERGTLRARVAEIEAEVIALETTLGAIANALGVPLADRPEGIEAAAKNWRERAEVAEAAARWIPVGEALPDVDVYVLVVNSGGHQEVARLAVGPDGPWFRHIGSVTHWRPLGPGPEVEK